MIDFVVFCKQMQKDFQSSTFVPPSELIEQEPEHRMKAEVSGSYVIPIMQADIEQRSTNNFNIFYSILFFVHYSMWIFL